MKRSIVILAAFAVLFSTAGQASAAFKVLFLGYDSNVAAVKADILGTDSRFDLVNSAFLEVPGGAVPSLATLQQYDSVLVFTNNFPGAGLGDRLADYADAGGGLVLASFNGFWEARGYFAGRINSHGYNPLTGPTTDAYNGVTLGVYDSTSPLFAGVTTLASSRFNSDYTGVDPGATLVGSWSNGRPLAALNANGKIAAVTLFPNVAQYGHATGDYQQLFRNALAETASPNVVPTPAPSGLVLSSIAISMFGSYFGWRRRTAKPTLA